jgi:hypothetical protein
MKSRFLWVVCAALASPSAWAVFKCQGADGAVVFQDAPCPADGKKMDISATPSADREIASRQREAQEAEKRISDGVARLLEQRAVAQTPLTIGMTSEQVRAAWGQPSKVNVSVNSHIRSEQWVYRRGPRLTQYAYIENGRLRSIQNVE